MSYCLKCKKKTNTKNISYFKSKNNRVKQKGTCSVCGSQKSKFISKHKRGGDIQSFCEEVNLQQLEYRGNYIYQGILSVVQAQTWIKD